MWDSDFLALMFRVEDQYVRAVAGHPWNGVDSVCTDSCVEFFVSPVEGSDAYLNCEVNPGGTMLIEAHDGVISGGIGDDKPTIHEIIPMSTTMPPNIESVRLRAARQYSHTFLLLNRGEQNQRTGT